MCSLKKIILTGPESSGKTTLARELAQHYHTVWAPEYAREYLSRLDRDYRQEDLLQIARGQLALEDQLAKEADNYLFCDTSLEVIAIWSQVKYGHIDPLILQWIDERTYTGYLLCRPDLPWEADPLREAPQVEQRQQLAHLYRQWLTERELPWQEIYGTGPERLERAIQALQSF